MTVTSSQIRGFSLVQIFKVIERRQRESATQRNKKGKEEKVIKKRKEKKE